VFLHEPSPKFCPAPATTHSHSFYHSLPPFATLIAQYSLSLSLSPKHTHPHPLTHARAWRTTYADIFVSFAAPSERLAIFLAKDEHCNRSGKHVLHQHPTITTHIPPLPHTQHHPPHTPSHHHTSTHTTTSTTTPTHHPLPLIDETPYQRYKTKIVGLGR